MFSYYGSKSKIVHLYPKPKYDKIIEPFAGSARYSLKYFDREVLLVDKYQVIIDIWLWLQKCSEKDILGLPKLYKGMDLRKMDLSNEERLFLGFLAGHGGIQPRNKISFMADYNQGNQNVYKKIAYNLYKIKHWKIKCIDFTDIENEQATWFIDPPYQFGGEYYKESSKKIDFTLLADWCKNRNGQAIVCENIKADWMPFNPLVKIQGVKNTNTTEAIWSSEKINSNIQSTLF